jgi:hypothetical protein
MDRGQDAPELPVSPDKKESIIDLMRLARTTSSDGWPALPLDEWKPTYNTLHMWTQVVGKVSLALTPRVNHWWNVAMFVSARGLTTPPLPYGDIVFQVELDFVEHELLIRVENGQTRQMPLEPRPVAEFYEQFMAELRSLGIEVKIWPMPVEIPDPIRFDQDFTHASYDPHSANRFWRILASVDTVLKEFRAAFIGKCSPVHFFWGSFDHCVTRFSGRPAPERPGADSITREAYSHEVISAGFWPGGGNVKGAAFYAYAAPEPQGFAETRVTPDAAFYDRELKEFFLMYDDVRRASDPGALLLSFLQSTYDAGATLGNWDRMALERSPAAAAG